MSISKASKMNGLANQLHKKPMNCGYGSKKITVPFEQFLSGSTKVYEWNDQITEVLREIPNHEGYLLVRKAFLECGLRKES